MKTTKRQDKQVKGRLTVHLPVRLIARVKDATFWTPGLTLTQLATEALETAVHRLERQRGSPFPPRTGPLKTGHR